PAIRAICSCKKSVLLLKPVHAMRYISRLIVLICISTCSIVGAVNDASRHFLENSEECAIQSDSILYLVTSIEKNSVTCHDGKVYTKLKFDSELEEFITLSLRDSKKSAVIWKHY